MFSLLIGEIKEENDIYEQSSTDICIQLILIKNKINCIGCTYPQPSFIKLFNELPRLVIAAFPPSPTMIAVKMALFPPA